MVSSGSGQYSPPDTTLVIRHTIKKSAVSRYPGTGLMPVSARQDTLPIFKKTKSWSFTNSDQLY